MARKRANPTWPKGKGVPVEPRPGVFTPQEAAAFLKVDPSTIYRCCKTGQLPAIKLGDTWRIGAAAVYSRLSGWPVRTERTAEQRERARAT